MRDDEPRATERPSSGEPPATTSLAGSSAGEGPREPTGDDRLELVGDLAIKECLASAFRKDWDRGIAICDAYWTRFTDRERGWAWRKRHEVDGDEFMRRLFPDG